MKPIPLDKIDVLYAVKYTATNPVIAAHSAAYNCRL